MHHNISAQYWLSLNIKLYILIFYFNIYITFVVIKCLFKMLIFFKKALNI